MFKKVYAMVYHLEKIAVFYQFFNQILSTFYSFLNSSLPGGRARWIFGTISRVLSLADIRTTFISEDTIQASFHRKSLL